MKTTYLLLLGVYGACWLEPVITLLKLDVLHHPAKAFWCTLWIGWWTYLFLVYYEEYKKLDDNDDDSFLT